MLNVFQGVLRITEVTFLSCHIDFGLQSLYIQNLFALFQKMTPSNVASCYYFNFIEPLA